MQSVYVRTPIPFLRVGIVGNASKLPTMYQIFVALEYMNDLVNRDTRIVSLINLLQTSDCIQSATT